MTTWSSAHDAAKMTEVAVKAFEAFEWLLDDGGLEPAIARAAIKSLLKSIKDGYAGLTSPELIIVEISMLRLHFALENKFDNSDAK